MREVRGGGWGAEELAFLVGRGGGGWVGEGEEEEEEGGEGEEREEGWDHGWVGWSCWGRVRLVGEVAGLEGGAWGVFVVGDVSEWSMGWCIVSRGMEGGVRRAGPEKLREE